MTAPVAIPDTEEHAADGPSGPYRLMLSIPPGPPPPGGHACVVLLDAENCFATAAEMLRQGAQWPPGVRTAPAVLLGIGYPPPRAAARARRTLDYSAGPPALGRFGPGVPDPTAGAVGGRDGFLRFLLDTALPLAGGRVPLDPARRFLVGHSMAGMLALDVLAHDGGAFAGYAALSPSVWWDPDRWRAGLAGGDAAPPGTRAFVSVGEWEESLAPWEAAAPGAEVTAARRRSRGMVSGARAAADALAARGLAARFECLPDETHGSALPAGLGRAMRALLGA